MYQNYEINKNHHSQQEQQICSTHQNNIRLTGTTKTTRIIRIFEFTRILSFRRITIITRITKFAPESSVLSESADLFRINRFKTIIRFTTIIRNSDSESVTSPKLTDLPEPQKPSESSK